MESARRIDAELVVVGAGYAGINAVYAACSHLAKGDTIAWIDPRMSIGGQWVDQYDYVTLHQPYETFNIAGRKWNRDWHWSHLASKVEILEYFEESIAEITAKSGVNIRKVFGYKMSSYTASEEDNNVQVFAESVDISSTAVVVHAKRMIKAIGFDVPIKQPVQFSAAASVNSTCPVDLLNPAVVKSIKASDKPIFVIGSGKTAIDTINMLVKKLNVGSRIYCICGHGTIFINRDKAFPTGFIERNMYGKNTVIDWFREAAQKYDGGNTQEVLRMLQDAGMLHSPIQGSTNFLVG